jgi:hypothetical protein
MEGMIRSKYGAKWRPVWISADGQVGPIPDWHMELIMCRESPDGLLPYGGKVARGNLGFETHFIRLVEALWAKKWFLWNPNARRMFKAFLNHRRLGVMGHASSGKTRVLAMLALTLFLIYEDRTMIILTSTTLAAAEGKLWGEVKNGWNALIALLGDEKQLPGRKLESKNAIFFHRDGKDDTTKGIRLVACEQSSDKESSDKIQGAKAPLFITLIDELDTMGDALMATVRSNLSSNKGSRLFATFNPTKRFTTAGLFVTPKVGWGRSGVDENSDEWETETGWCIRFDGRKSPNVIDSSQYWPGLLDQDAIEEIATNTGGKNTPGFWRDVIAWFSPMGFKNSVLNENEIILNLASDAEIGWGLDRPTFVGGLDTSNTAGGDKSVLTIGKVGTVQRVGKDGQTFGLKIIEIVATLEFRHDMTNPQSPEEQLARWVKISIEQPRFSAHPSCHPLVIGNIAIDETGGTTVLPLIRRDIGEPMKINFKSKPSDKIVSLSDGRKGTDLFVNKRAQMWWIRPLIRDGVIRGMPPAAIAQMCECQFTQEGGDKGKIQIEDKDALIKRIKRSPDDADSFVLCVEVARALFDLTSTERPKSNPRPGYRFMEYQEDWEGHPILVDGKPVPLVDLEGKRMSFEVALYTPEERQRMERFMTDKEKLDNARLFGPPPVEEEEYPMLNYPAGMWED